MNNFIYQNKLDSVSALWSKKMALEILCDAFKKGYNNWVSTFLKTLLWMAKCCYGNCLWRVPYHHNRCSQEAAVNLHTGIKKYFHFVKKRPKWWLISILILHQIIVLAPSSVLGLLSFTNLSAGGTALSLVSIKTANIYEIHKALYGAGWGQKQKFYSLFNLLYLRTFRLQ